MIQFINCMAVWGKNKARYLTDAMQPVCLPIDRIVEVRSIHHSKVRDLFDYESDEGDDAVGGWTCVEVSRRYGCTRYYVYADLDRVMRAIAFLNLNKDRTTCYVDDFSCKDCG